MALRAPVIPPNINKTDNKKSVKVIVKKKVDYEKKKNSLNPIDIAMYGWWWAFNQ